jgi:pimeloyl-ACP methyl ester carboxylesterase
VGHTPALEWFDWHELRLAARLFPRRESAPGTAPRLRPTVLFFHGWQGAQDANDVLLAAALAGDGFACMTFDLAGHGHSGGAAGQFTLADYLDQALSAHDFLLSSGLAGTGDLCLCGASLGSYLAARLSALRPVRAMSLRVPANYPDEIVDAELLGRYVQGPAPRIWREQPRAPADNRALAALRSFGGPLQIIAAGRDETIPWQTVKNFIAAAADTTLDLHVLPEATHVLYENEAMRAESFRLVRGWLRDLT